MDRSGTARHLQLLTLPSTRRYIETQLGTFANGGRNTLATRRINNFGISLTRKLNITESSFSICSITRRLRRGPLAA
jgi:hypothetical protein